MDVESFRREATKRRHAMRRKIIDHIRFSAQTEDDIRTVVGALLASRTPGRLDDAIDILSELSAESFQRLAFEVVSDDRTPEADDYRYVFIRGLARAYEPENARAFVHCLAKLRNRTNREAVVEALGDLGDAESQQLLRRIAKTDTSPFIRRLATEVLEELTE